MVAASKAGNGIYMRLFQGGSKLVRVEIGANAGDIRAGMEIQVYLSGAKRRCHHAYSVRSELKKLLLIIFRKPIYTQPMKFSMYALLILLLCGCNDTGTKDGLVRTSSDGKSQIIMAQTGDARIAAATKEARRRLPEFVKALQNPTLAQRCLLKIPVTDGKVTEFMWINEIKYDGSSFFGTFIDDAFDVSGPYKKGLQGACRATDISDWLYIDGDKQVGGFTTKILEELAAQNPKNRVQ